MSNQYSTRFRYIAAVLLMGLILALVFCAKPKVTPPEEVPADFSIDAGGNPSISPDPIYVKAGKQKVHWRYHVEKLDITFGNDRPFPDPACHHGNCISDVPDRNKIRTTPYKYTVSGTDNGKPFQLDPRLVVGE